MKRRWSWGCWSHSQRKGEKPATSGVRQSSVQMKSGLRHWGRNFLDYLEGCFLHEQREVSAVEAMLVTVHCLSSFSGCLFGNSKSEKRREDYKDCLGWMGLDSGSLE